MDKTFSAKHHHNSPPSHVLIELSASRPRCDGDHVDDLSKDSCFRQRLALHLPLCPYPLLPAIFSLPHIGPLDAPPFPILHRNFFGPDDIALAAAAADADPAASAVSNRAIRTSRSAAATPLCLCRRRDAIFSHGNDLEIRGRD